MLHPIYTSVNNANQISCGKKGKIVTSQPIPLLRDKYLGEYRTELERAKVRKNLGIADESSLIWGGLTGNIEDQKDLVNYVQSKWSYSSDLSEDITDVASALDYVIYFVTNYKVNDEQVQELTESVELLKRLISEDLEVRLSNHDSSIEEISQSISNINIKIQELNDSLATINVDKNILDWVSTHMSDTIEYRDGKLQVVVSDLDGNALTFKSGLFVKDYSKEITELTSSSESYGNSIEQLQSSVNLYITDLPDGTTSPTGVGGLPQNTLVDDLKGKTISQILDTILFPAYTAPLVQPRLYYGPIQTLVKVMTPIVYPELIFDQGDAGEEISREQVYSWDSDVTSTYNQVGSFVYTGTVTYADGEYQKNNRGEVTNQRIPAGSLTTSVTVVATYPWYKGSVGDIQEQPLVAFGVSSGIKEIQLTGQSVIKLPGANSEIITFEVNGGLGWTEVNLAGWVQSTELIDNVTYSVWTKSDSYGSSLPHRLTFELQL